MKVLFLVKSEKTPSSRIRILDVVPGLKRYGLEPEIEIIPSTFWKRWKLYRRASEFPVTVLQKRLLSGIDFHELRRMAHRLIFDFDDAIYCKNASCSPNSEDYDSPTRMGKFIRTVHGADMIIAANRVLAEKAIELAPAVPVRIIPSSVPVLNVPHKTEYSLGNPPVIGWLGTKSTLRYLDMIAPIFCELRKKHDFILRVLSNEKYSLRGINVDSRAWSLEKQEEEIAKFDIGIMPLSDDPFSKGKSAYKLLQYFAGAVPSVCSPVGMNAELAKNDEFCLAAPDNDTFKVKLEKLIIDRVLREEIGRKARGMVIERFERAVVTKQLANAILEFKRPI